MVKSSLLACGTAATRRSRVRAPCQQQMDGCDGKIATFSTAIRTRLIIMSTALRTPSRFLQLLESESDVVLATG